MSTVTLTEAAAYEVKDMLKSNDMEGGYLKIKVNGGGCTGQHMVCQLKNNQEKMMKYLNFMD